MKILFKLTSAFLLMALLLGFIGYISFRNISMAYDSFDLMNVQTIPAIAELNTMRQGVLTVSPVASEIIIYSLKNSSTSDNIKHELNEMNEGKEVFERSFARYSALVDKYFPDEAQRRDEIRNDWERFYKLAGLTASSSAEPGSEHFENRQQAFEQSEDSILEAINGALLSESAELKERQQSARAILTSSLNVLLVSIWIFVVLSIAGILASYYISKSAMKLKDSAEEIRKGNLDVRADVSSKDELGELAATLNSMVSELKKSRADLEERNNELNKKVAEMAETKTAILNMMDDAEELNRELVQAQERLNENLKVLKETDIKKNEFMSIAAHELKTPMTSIHGFSQLLQNKDVSKDPKKRGKYLQIMDRETTRLAKLVNDILDLSRIDLNAVTFDISDVDLYGVVDTVKTELAVQMKQKGLESEYDIERGMPKIRTDRERLTQVLMNLINNAIKYTPKGKISITISREGSHIHFIVKDTGIGISKANQSKIFSRFYQVDSSYTRSAGGVGLGLSLCKEFVELLGGKIWFTSELNKGSEFHFNLPIRGISKNSIRKHLKTNSR